MLTVSNYLSKCYLFCIPNGLSPIVCSLQVTMLLGSIVGCDWVTPALSRDGGNGMTWASTVTCDPGMTRGPDDPTTRGTTTPSDDC